MTKFLLTVFLILSLGSITSCGRTETPNEDGLRGRRTRPPLPETPLATDETEPGATDPSQEEPDFTLPVHLVNEKENKMILDNVKGDEEGYKLSISAKQKGAIFKKPSIQLQAAFDGVVSIQTTEKTHIITLSSSTTDLVFYFQLHKKTYRSCCSVRRYS